MKLSHQKLSAVLVRWPVKLLRPCILEALLVMSGFLVIASYSSPRTLGAGTDENQNQS